MNDETPRQGHELVPVPSEQTETLSEVIKPFIPVLEAFFDHQKQVSEQQTQIQKQQLDLSKAQTEGNFAFAKDRLKFEEKRQGRQLVVTLIVLVPIILASLGSAVGLIFLKDKVEAGVFLLTHLVAFAVGLIGGAGWQKAKQDVPRK